MKIRALLCGRPDLLSKPGGDTHQVLTCRRSLACHAKISLELQPDLSGVDVVHLFNLSRPMEPLVQALHARSRGVPVVLTAIHQDLAEYGRLGRMGGGRRLFDLLGRDPDTFDRLRSAAHLLRAGAPAAGAVPLIRSAIGGRLPGSAPADLRCQLLRCCDALILNSSREAAAVRERLGPYECSEKVVPLGIDPEEHTTPDPAPFLRRYGLEAGFVLSVARLEDLKNQLSLIAAMDRIQAPLILIAPPNPRHRSYGLAVLRAASRRPRTLVIPHIDRWLLLSAMAAAAVHVLPSWFESVGLSSLEAAAEGCAVVSTDRGFAATHLGDEAHYCSPGDPGSIRDAVHRALRTPAPPHLRERMMDEHDCRITAQLIEDTYQEVLA